MVLLFFLLMYLFSFFFFFSSRRRHTRLVSDWSSDVCSSDLEAKNALTIWGNIFQLSFPYFVLSAAIAGLVLTASQQIGWQAPLLVLPVMLGVYHSYKRYFSSGAASAPLANAKAATAS